MKKIFFIVFIVYSLAGNTQDIKILDDFVFFGMINCNVISINKHENLYEIEKTKFSDSMEYLSLFLTYARKLLKNENLVDDINIDSTHKYAVNIYSKNISKILEQYFIYNELQTKEFPFSIFQKERYYKRTFNDYKIDNEDKYFSYLIGAFMRNGIRENNVITYRFLFDMEEGGNDEWKPLYIFECLQSYCAYTQIKYNLGMTDFMKCIEIIIDIDKSNEKNRTFLLNDIGKYLK